MKELFIDIKDTLNDSFSCMELSVRAVNSIAKYFGLKEKRKWVPVKYDDDDLDKITVGDVLSITYNDMSCKTHCGAKTFIHIQREILRYFRVLK